MKIYIWERANHVSDAYHSEGGAVAIAETENNARKQLNEISGCKIEENEKADHVLDLSEKAAFVFPDAGCC